MSSTLEEVQMQETLIFSDTIKDLKTLRSQLYSAAEYFELAYMQEDGKQAYVLHPSLPFLTGDQQAKL
nr:unnamed protein product [Digitaria exilis]